MTAYRLVLFKTGTSVYKHLQAIRGLYEIIVLQGGTSSSKTISVLQELCYLAIHEKGLVITVTGQDLPNLKKGALRDFKNLILENPGLRNLLVNPKAKEGPYEFKSGSIIEFASFDSSQDAKSGKRDYLFVNEANGVPYEIFFELEQRTKRCTFIDYNPTNLFWAHTEVLPQPNAYGFISTFMDNEYCPAKTKAQLKGYFLKWKQTGQAYWLNKWKVNGLGQTGIVEGLVIPHFNIVDRFPDKSELEYFGYSIDWGFANDPLALSKCGNRKGNLRLVAQELIYETGINAYSLDELMPTYGITKQDPIIADSANLDAIDWLARQGWNIVPADKPPGSIKQGIELLNQIGIDVVQGSVNAIHELGSYMYKQKTGAFDKNTPVDRDNHLIDSIRYFGRWAILNKGVNPRKVSGGKRKSRAY